MGLGVITPAQTSHGDSLDGVFALSNGEAFFVFYFTPFEVSIVLYESIQFFAK